MSRCGIYIATNLLDGKLYVGQTKDFDKRKKQHIYTQHKENYFQRSIKKYGVNNFHWQLIEFPLDKLDEMEQFYIREFDTMVDSGTGYNLVSGGNRPKYSIETRKKISKSRMGSKPNSGSFKKGRCGNHTPHTEESKLKQSKSMMGKPPNKTSFKKGHKGNIGFKHSEDTKQKMRKPKSEEFKKKMSSIIWLRNNPICYG
jgi:group I intron endonuclease